MRRASRNGFADADGDDPEETGPDLRLMLGRSLARSFPCVLLLTGLGAAVGIGVGLLKPNLYESHAKLTLRMGAREQITSESLVDDGERPHAPLPTLVDEMQMLSDVAIFERVARELGPAVVLVPADPGRDDGLFTAPPIRLYHLLQKFALRGFARMDASPGEDQVRLATRVLKQDANIQNEPGSSVIHIAYKATSPETARTIVQALAQGFIERHRAQYSVKSVLERSRSQLEQARQDRDEAAKAYVDQVSRSGIALLESQLPRLEVEVSAVEADLFAARLRKEEIARLRSSLSERLTGIPAEVEIQRPAVMVPNEEYETQLALKRMLLAQKQEMLIQTRPSEERSRQEKEFDNQIAKVDQKLKGTPKVVVQGSEMHENLGHAAMESRIVDLEVEEETLPGKLELLESRLESKKARLAELQKQVLSATMLRKDLAAGRDSQESRYAQLVNRVSMLESLESIDANEEANLRLLQAPTLELKKVGPDRLSLFLKGLLAGMAAALAFAVLRQRFDRRLRYPEMFERARGVPVLGVVPHLSSLRRLRARAAVRGVEVWPSR